MGLSEHIQVSLGCSWQEPCSPAVRWLPAYAGQGSSLASTPWVREKKRVYVTPVTETPELIQKSFNWDVLQLPFLAQMMPYSFQHRLESNKTQHLQTTLLQLPYCSIFSTGLLYSSHFQIFRKSNTLFSVSLKHTVCLSFKVTGYESTLLCAALKYFWIQNAI